MLHLQRTALLWKIKKYGTLKYVRENGKIVCVDCVIYSVIKKKKVKISKPYFNG